MKKKTRTVEHLCILLIISLCLVSCKDGDSDSSGWFSGTENIVTINAEDIQSGIATLPEEENLLHTELVKEFYEKRNNAPVWNEADARKAYFEELQNVGNEGLSAKDYHGEEIERLMQDLGEETSRAQFTKLEFLLTDSFLSYAQDLYYGKIDPKELYSLWGIKRQELDVAGLLQKAADQQDFVSKLDSLKPNNEIYAGLKKSLREYRELKEKDTLTTRIEPGAVIKPGDKDPRIETIAARLKQLEFLDSEYSNQENEYDEELEAAVKRFQEERDLEPDGILGNTTYKALNMNDTERFKKILVNLERWRWYPRDLGDHYILVNIPDFTLAVVKEGDTVRRHDVIAGSKARQTPVFTDTLEYIVINPQWNIPPTIQNQDIIPKAANNPSYLRNNNISVTSPSGERLDPSSIDWSSSEVRSYRYSQSAGPSNPLGRVKIIYPNQYLIYLHDTPSKSLFERSDRAESSGCVRVEDAIDLSAYVVENQPEWDLERIKETIAQGSTKQVKITEPIQVHHFYWTAWRGNGNTVFTDDVYDLDEEVYAALTGSD